MFFTTEILIGALEFAHLAAARDPPDFSTYQYPNAPKVEFQPEYDFCIVGGGTAGLFLANRLTESGKHNVIVFEAGPSPDTVASYKSTGGHSFGLNGARSLIDYNFATVPQQNLKNRTLTYHRGRALGGSSTTNGLFYGMGSSTVYDSWEADGNPGWNWTTIQAAAKHGTVFVGNPDNTNDRTGMTWDSENYGTEGPLKIGFQGYVSASVASFMNATSAVGLSIVHDQNGGSPVGVKQGTMTIDENFERSSSYDSYCQAAKHRTNLNVRDRAVVTQVIFDEETLGSDEVHAIGVSFMDSGIFHNISCSKEVIISGGAFHSPYILKQSGIGPQEELEEYGVTVVVANENVGHHMQDHTSFSVIFAVKPEFADIAGNTDMVKLTESLHL